MELSQEATRPCAELDPNLSVKPPFGPSVAEIALWDRDGDTVTTDAGNPQLRHNGQSIGSADGRGGVRVVAGSTSLPPGAEYGRPLCPLHLSARRSMATCQLGFLMDLTWLLHGGRPVRPRPRLRCEGCVGRC